jgi:putative phosphonate metabolism protein
MIDARYAVFFVPPQHGALYRFGATALGYDSYSGEDAASFSGDGIDAAEWHKLTAEPRRYGFHATLKAPFRLRDGTTEHDLIAAIAPFAAGGAPPPRFDASVALLDGFAALIPAAPAPSLDRLAESCVREFDRFRAPLTDAQRSRRLAQPLTARQTDHLERWGYPYVLDDFRFHMTLTGRLPADRAPHVLEFLHRRLACDPVSAGIAVESIALLRQDAAAARFRVIAAAPLGALPDAASDDRIAARG